MSVLKLYHGSNNIIEKPSLSQAKPYNDYGKGFYCTENIEMAKEWACKNKENGYVNEYSIDTSGLKILNLLDNKHTILNWIALLLNNRTFNINDEIGMIAKDYIINNYLIDLNDYDIVIGYRADDSYFSYAYSFIHNGLSLKSLSKALMLGGLGVQVVLISEIAFNALHFVSSIDVDYNIYHMRYLARDIVARISYKEKVKKGKISKDDIFIMDIIREEMKNDDPRLQRFIFK